MHSDLTIITVSYNSGRVLLSNWKKFLETTGCPVLIIDNASTDDSSRVLSQSFPQHSILKSECNVGYGRAANFGMRHCHSRFALLLNPDLRISEEVVHQLFSTAITDTENTAIWAPATSKSEISCAPPSPIEAVCGAAMLFDLDKIRRVGLFDENIFLYSEETDLCYRTRREGYLIKLCPSIYIEHIGASSSGHHNSLIYMKSWHFGWSRCYYLNKHGLFSRKYNPRRMYLDYTVKSYISLSRDSRLRYRGQAEGVKAFMRGEKAFAIDGKPQGDIRPGGEG